MAQPPDAEVVDDLFVSYAHGDDQDGWVAALVETIRAEHARFTPRPLGIFFDRHKIKTMDQWEDRILAGLRSSKLMLAVLSPAYFASPFCRREWEVYVEHERARAVPGQGIAPIYIVTAPGLEESEAAAALDKWLVDLKSRQYLDLRPWRPDGAAALEREEVRLRLQALEGQIKERIDRIERASASPTTVPGHNPSFVGRRDEIALLRRTLARGEVGAITAVHGVGGIGKTALAFEYAHTFAAEYLGGRFLIGAAGVDDLRAAVVNLAPRKGVELTEEERQNLEAAFARVRAAFENGPPSLLVLDNLDDPALVSAGRRAESLPGGPNVHILVTTRLEPDNLPGLKCLALDALPDSDALRLLENHRAPEGDDEWKAALRIARRLGGHALAVEVVAVFLWQNPEVSYAAFLTRLEREGLGAIETAAGDELVQRSEIRHPERLIGPLLEPTLRGLSPAESLALEYAALLPPDRIPLPWLRELVGLRYPRSTREPAEGYPDPWGRLVRRLFGLRLLTPADDDRLVRMHRLLQEVVCASAAGNWWQRLLRSPLRFVPFFRRYYDRAAWRRSQITDRAWDRAELLLDQCYDRDCRWEVDGVYDYALLLMDEGDEAGASLVHTLFRPLFASARLSECRRLYRTALDFSTARFGPADPRLLAVCVGLAQVEEALGNTAEAKRLLSRAMEIGQEACGPDDADMVNVYSALGNLEKNLGNLDEARKLLRRAIAIGEQERAEDRETLVPEYSKLAMVERQAGNLLEARKLQQRVLATKEELHGPNHPEVATSCGNLASIEQDLGNLAGARELYRRGTEIYESFLEPEHPLLATIYANLATLETDLDNHHEARRLFRKSLAIREKLVEPDHPDLSGCLSGLGSVEDRLGNHEEARRLLRRALAIDARTVGEEHPRMAVSCNNLAAVEAQLGNHDEARALARRALATSEKLYGPEHIFAATCYSTLAGIELIAGDRAKARELLHKSLALFDGFYGKDHPHSVAILAKLAGLERNLGHHAAARDMFRRAIVVREKVGLYGTDGTGNLLFALGTAERQLGNHAAAREALRRALNIWRDVLPLDHQKLGSACHWLGLVERDLGNQQAAQHLLQHALAIRLKTVPPDDPSLADLYSVLGVVESALGHHDQARDRALHAVALWQKSLPPEHPSLATAYYNLGRAEASLENPSSAAQALRRAVDIYLQAPQPDPVWLADSRFHLALAQQALGHPEDARQLMLAACPVLQAQLGAQHPLALDAKQWLEREGLDKPGGDANTA